MSSFALRPFQLEALQALESAKHLILMAPTGSGKSAIFQEFLYRNPQLRALLISPLNALTRQHVEQLKLKFAGSAFEVRGGSQERPPSGPGVLVTSPEMLKYDQRIKAWDPNFLIVDEAHCIWEWGEGFRPEYKFLFTVAREWSIRNSFWCTATFPPQARIELKRELGFPIKELGRYLVPSQLTIQSERVFISERISAVYDYVNPRQDRLGIIFSATRKMSERLGVFLKQWKIPFWIYHAGMSPEERGVLEAQFKKENRGIIIATSAFGMGMDLAQLRYCILFDPPFTLLSLSQALGRATRTGQPAEGLVLWHEDDFKRLEWMIQGRPQRERELDWVKRWCESGVGKEQFLENYFNSTDQGCAAPVSEL